MNNHDSKPDLLKSLNSPAGFFLVLIVGGAAAMAISITFAFWQDRMPVWIAVPMLFSLIATVVGATTNNRWDRIARLLFMGIALLVIIACSSFFLNNLDQGSSAAPAPVDSLVKIQSALFDAAMYYITALFIFLAVVAWKKPKTNSDEEANER